MPVSRLATAVSGIVLSLTGTGCAVLQPPASYTGMAEVTPVVTEHSYGLQCLGSIIEESRLEPLLVDVDRIRDRTIPSRLTRESRLSQAGEWLVHTAISKLETPRVRSTMGKTREKPDITLSGAWTQDDELLKRAGGLFDFGWLRGRLGLEANQSYDYIAGDFTTSSDGIVQFSTAIGVMLGSRRIEARLFVEDGDEFAEIGFDGRRADGPQLAQRRIAEAAILIHIARYYDVDYKPCLESGWGDPDAFKASLATYASLNESQRNQRAQRSLVQLGYGDIDVSGDWNSQARQALMSFQSAERLPVTGKLSPVVFALLEGAVGQQTVTYNGA